MKKIILLASLCAILLPGIFFSRDAAGENDCTVYFVRSESAKNGCREVWKINGKYYGTKWFSCGDSPYNWEDIKLVLKTACMQNKEPEGFEPAGPN
jgi:hypothetical protein